jgi:chromosome segregation ATPase
MEKMVQGVFEKQRKIDATLATIKTSVTEIMTQKEDLEH